MRWYLGSSSSSESHEQSMRLSCGVTVGDCLDLQPIPAVADFHIFHEHVIFFIITRSHIYSRNYHKPRWWKLGPGCIISSLTHRRFNNHQYRSRNASHQWLMICLVVISQVKYYSNPGAGIENVILSTDCSIMMMDLSGNVQFSP